MIYNDTICAIATAPGKGAISIIRICGTDSLQLCNSIFKAHNGKKLSSKYSQKSIIGYIILDNNILDEVLITFFNSPRSYTGEDIIEIYCHGSAYIQSAIIQILIKNGCRLAKKGEFTLRAFLNGKLDLSQAEGVAELIASDNQQAYGLAIEQMRGGFSSEIQNLRKKFIKFASLIELELDFSQEDVEFANREELLKFIIDIKNKIHTLIQSFKFGNAIKNGVPISIVGKPNSGKSTLLNQILKEDRAIVSDIQGTTRDIIEESITINGYKLRFIDTAGLRKTNNKIEKIGISKTYQKINESALVLYIIDKSDFHTNQIQEDIRKIQNQIENLESIIFIGNKNDLNQKIINISNSEVINISAKNGSGIEKLLNVIISKVEQWKELDNQIIIINQRHFESLNNTLNSLEEVEKGLTSNLSGEFLTIDIKRCLQFLGEITGEITNENLLDSIFQDFCIGK